MRISEEDIATTHLAPFDEFLVAERGETGSGVRVDRVRVPKLPEFYHPHAPAKPGPHQVLVIEVNDAPISEQTVERIRGALLARLSVTDRE